MKGRKLVALRVRALRRSRRSGGMNGSVIICDSPGTATGEARSPQKKGRRGLKRTHYENPLKHIEQSNKRFKGLADRTENEEGSTGRRLRSRDKSARDSVIILSDTENENSDQEDAKRRKANKKKHKRRQRDDSSEERSPKRKETSPLNDLTDVDNVKRKKRKKKKALLPENNNDSCVLMSDIDDLGDQVTTIEIDDDSIAPQAEPKKSHEPDDITVVWSSVGTEEGTVEPEENKEPKGAAENCSCNDCQADGGRLYMIDRAPNRKNLECLNSESEDSRESTIAEKADNTLLPFSTHGLRLPKTRKKLYPQIKTAGTSRMKTAKSTSKGGKLATSGATSSAGSSSASASATTVRTGVYGPTSGTVSYAASYRGPYNAPPGALRNPPVYTAPYMALDSFYMTGQSLYAASNAVLYSTPNPAFQASTASSFAAVPTTTSTSTGSTSTIYPSTAEIQGGQKRGALREIVIDGNNVAMAHTNGRSFSEVGLKLVIDYFKQRGHKVKVFVPQYRRSQQHQLLEKLHLEGTVVFTPSRQICGRNIVPYDDRYILQYATMCEGIVVSSDQFRDLFTEKPEWRSTIVNRLLAPTFVDDFVMFPEDPLGRNGPRLDEFLRHS